MNSISLEQIRDILVLTKEGILWRKHDNDNKKIGTSATSTSTLLINNIPHQTAKIIYFFYHGTYPKYLIFNNGNGSDYAIKNLKEITKSATQIKEPSLSSPKKTSENKYVATLRMPSQSTKHAAHIGTFSTRKEAYHALLTAHATRIKQAIIEPPKNTTPPQIEPLPIHSAGITQLQNSTRWIVHINNKNADIAESRNQALEKLQKELIDNY